MTAQTASDFGLAEMRRLEELRRILEVHAPKDAAVILRRLEMAGRKR